MYVKKFDSEGKLLNPITKDKPFINEPTKEKHRKVRRKPKMVVTRFGKTFYKVKIYYQRVGGKLIEHSQFI